MRRILVAGIGAALAIAAAIAPPAMAYVTPSAYQAPQIAHELQPAEHTLVLQATRSDDLRTLHAAERKNRGASSRRADDAEPIAKNMRATARDQRSKPLLL